MRRPEIALDILICDADDLTRTNLHALLENEGIVRKVAVAPSIRDAQPLLQDHRPNVVFIDPYLVGLDQASDFIFQCRKVLPQIVFVLYTDFARAEGDPDFYRGERHRFRHYYDLDKLLPEDARLQELSFVLLACQLDLRWKVSEDNRRRWGDGAELTLLDDLRGVIGKLTIARDRAVNRNTVFVSYRFDREEDIAALKMLLEREGFEIVTGRAADRSIGKAVLNRICDCEYFLSIVTRHRKLAEGGYSTSPWLLEEKGAALAFGKPIVLMIEDGVKDFGDLQGDWQRIHFSWKSFATAMVGAVRQVCALRGQRST